MNMEHIKIIGYFKENEEDHNIDNEALLYFVAYENSDHVRNEKWVEGFNVLDGHFVLRDENYIKSCTKVTKKEYINATKNWYTPKEYL